MTTKVSLIDAVYDLYKDKDTGKLFPTVVLIGRLEGSREKKMYRKVVRPYLLVEDRNIQEDMLPDPKSFAIISSNFSERHSLDGQVL